MSPLSFGSQQPTHWQIRSAVAFPMTPPSLPLIFFADSSHCVAVLHQRPPHPANCTRSVPVLAAT